MGICGLVSFTVAQHTRSWRSVGASGGRILSSILGESVGAVLKGLAAGVLVGSATALALSSFLVDVSPFDPAVAALVATVILSTVLLASLGPGVRAARIDPLLALRQQ